MKGLFSPQINLTAKVLDLRLERQNIVMGNITNVDTPSYKPRKLEFEKDLQAALALDYRGKVTRTDDQHMPAHFESSTFQGKGITEFNPRVIYGEDTVDLDKEMSVMAKNAMMYNALTEVIKKNFQGMQKVIQDGGSR